MRLILTTVICGLVLVTAPSPASLAQQLVVQCEQMESALVSIGSSAAMALAHGLMIWGGYSPQSITQANLLIFHPTNAHIDTMELRERGPAGVFIPAMAADERRGAIYVFGGWATGAKHPSDEFYRIDLGQRPYRWQQLRRSDPWPPARNGAAFVYDSVGDVLVLFGGDGGPGPEGFTPLSDLWTYNLSTGGWQQIPARGDTPPPRWHAMMTASPSSRRAYMIGGAGLGPEAFDTSLYEVDFATFSWQRLRTRGETPPSLQGATLTFDRENGVLVLAGGLRHRAPGTATISDAWVFDLAHGAWSRTDCGELLRRRDHIGAYDPETRAHYLLGGMVSSELGNFYRSGPRVTTIVRLRIIAFDRAP